VQAALLRVLEDLKVRPLGGRQELRVDVRIVAATSRSLAQEVAAGRFRRDLYYRLQVFEVELPPLREHKEDIPALVEHFVRSLAPALGAAPLAIEPSQMEYLQQYHWPGNVRELRNFIERSLILGELNVSALYGRPPGAADHADLQSLERTHILAVLESVGGDKTQAAKLLGVSRRTLERRQAEWGLR
jgi:DNA-binding NtrC family response regulator